MMSIVAGVPAPGCVVISIGVGPLPEVGQSFGTGGGAESVTVVADLKEQIGVDFDHDVGHRGVGMADDVGQRRATLLRQGRRAE